MAQVLKGGFLHAYNDDRKYDYTRHVEIQLEVLEQLSPEQGKSMRSRFEALRNRSFVGQDHISSVVADISDKLDELAPKGLYFGIPHSSNGCVGFWPVEWLKPGARGVPTHAQARLMPKCVIG